MQQQLDAESVQRLIGLLNESQVPDNEKQQEIHHVRPIPHRLDLQYSLANK